MTYTFHCTGSTYRVCKIRGYSRDILPAALSDEHIDIRLLRNSTRIWRTTNIPACVSGYIREETRTDLPFYKAHVTNVYTPLRDVPALGDGWAIASEAGSSVQTDLYVLTDSARDPEGNP